MQAAVSVRVHLFRSSYRTIETAGAATVAVVTAVAVVVPPCHKT